MNGDGDDRDADRAETAADALRGRARTAFGEIGDGANPLLRPGQILLGTIPKDAGAELAIIWSPSPFPQKSYIYFGVFRTGPGGERVSACAPIRMGAAALPAFADALGDALDLIAEQYRTNRRTYTGNRPPARRASGIPSTSNGAVTADGQDGDQHAHQGDDNQHHNAT